METLLTLAHAALATGRVRPRPPDPVHHDAGPAKVNGLRDDAAMEPGHPRGVRERARAPRCAEA